MERFKEKVAIVTGSGQGIGEGIARRLAREGAIVVVADFNPETAAVVAQGIVDSGGQGMAFAIDIGNVSAVNQMVDDVVSRYGRIDILVNNAGVVQTKPMMALTEADWDRIVRVNERGAFFCLQAVSGQMIKQVPEALRKAAEKPADIMNMKPQSASNEDLADYSSHCYGKIVNLSSISGRRGRPLSAHYAASKAAIISITQSAALALAPYNINVNAICPGIVVTPMWKQIDKERGDLFGAKPGEAVSAFINTVPLKRAATAEDLAGAVAFFCSEDANYITGQTLNVDGGYEMN